MHEVLQQYEQRRLDPKSLAPPAWPGRESKVELVRVGKVEAHPMPKTDSLEVTKVHGYPIVVGKGEFQEGDIAIYVPIGAKVPLHPNLEFIHRGQIRHCTIQARTFRFVTSCGVLLPAAKHLYLIDQWTGSAVHVKQAQLNLWLVPLLGCDVSTLIGAKNPA